MYVSFGYFKTNSDCLILIFIAQDLARIPLVIVILGCISGIAMLLVVVIILFNRNRGSTLG